MKLEQLNVRVPASLAKRFKKECQHFNQTVVLATALEHLLTSLDGGRRESFYLSTAKGMRGK